MNLRRRACFAVLPLGLAPLVTGCIALPLPGPAAVAYSTQPSVEAEYPAAREHRAPREAIADARDVSAAWDVGIERLDGDRVRFDLRMKRLATGGEGEARDVFARHVRRLAQAEGYVAYEVLGFEERIDSSWPFAQRVAVGEVRFARSRTWPGL